MKKRSRLPQQGEFTGNRTLYGGGEAPDLASHDIREVSVVRESGRRDRAPVRRPRCFQVKTAFAANGSVTAGNSSQMSDGAGAVIVASEAALKRFNLTPIARFLVTQ